MEGTYTLARPYAMAAFKQAREDDALESWSDALGALGAIMSDPQMQGAARNPKVGDDQLAKLLMEVGGDRFSGTTANFVKVLVESERILLAPEIHELFERFKADDEGSAQVEVLTAFELSDEDQKRIGDALEKHFKRKVSMNVQLDESLIGGVVVRSGDQVMDASVRGQLQQLGQRIVG